MIFSSHFNLEKELNKWRQTLKPLENKGFFRLSLLYRNGIAVPVSSMPMVWAWRRFRNGWDTAISAQHPISTHIWIFPVRSRLQMPFCLATLKLFGQSLSGNKKIAPKHNASKQFWCRWRESNPHGGLAQRILSSQGNKAFNGKWRQFSALKVFEKLLDFLQFANKSFKYVAPQRLFETSIFSLQKRASVGNASAMLDSNSVSPSSWTPNSDFSPPLTEWLRRCHYE